MSWLDKYFDGLDVKALYGDTFGGLMLGLGLGSGAAPPPPAPTVSSVYPDLGASDSPTLVRVKGTGFVDGCTCTIGAVSATVTFVSSTLVYASTGAATASSTAKDVVVTNPDAQTGTLAAAFIYYLPTMTGALPGGSTLVGWWDPSVVAKCRQGTTAGSTVCSNGSAIGYVIDRAGGSADLACLTGGSSNTTTPSILNAGGAGYVAADADNGLGCIQASTTASDRFFNAQASLTYNAILVAFKAASTQFSFAGDSIVDGDSSTLGVPQLAAKLGGSVFQDFGGTNVFHIPAGDFYAEDGFTGTIDATYSQVGGPNEWHVAAYILPANRSDYLLFLNQLDAHVNFNGGRLGEIIVLKDAVAADLQKAQRYLSAKWRSIYTSKQMYFDSDSLWEIGGLTAISQLVPQQTMAILAAAPQNPVTDWSFQNLAIGGQTFEQMVARQSWNVVDKFPARSKNAVAFAEWINSYFVGGKTAAQINTDFDTYLAAASAADFKIAATPTFTALETTSGQETDRQTIRSHILAAAGVTVADVGSPDGPFGQVVLGGPCSARWYIDATTHPTVDGATFMADVLATAISTALATNCGPVVNLADPVSGPNGQAVTFYGANIPSTLTGIDFGATAATGVSRVHAWRVDCTAPTHADGAVDVTFHFSDRADVVFASAFTFANSFNPLVVAGGALYLDAALGVSATGGYIDTVADQTGNGHDATGHAGSGGHKPQLIASGINGKPSWKGTTDIEFFRVAGVEPGAFLTAFHAFFILQGNGDTDPPAAGQEVWDFGSFPGYCDFTDGNVYDDFGSAARPGSSGTGGHVLTSPYCLEVSYAGSGNRLVKINGTTIITEASPTVTWGSSTLGQVQLMLSSGGGFRGLQSALFVYDHQLSAPDRATVAAGILSQWGITI